MNSNMWSPWRSEYVQDADRDNANTCFLCGAAETGEEANGTFVGAHGSAIVVVNRFPYNAGHLLVAPTSHIPDLLSLSETESAELMAAVRHAMRIIEIVMKPHGMNVGINQGSAGGAGVPGHLHVHIVPRWNGDTNFMPTIADVSVVSASLSKLVADFRSAHKDIQVL